MTLKIVYFGTPDYAVPALEALAEDTRFDVVLVVTQPDRPAGRGHKLTPPPVKIAAERLGMPVYQPLSLRTKVAREPLAAAGADLFVVAAFGLIFGEKTLSIPRLGCVNLHASLLPSYRGASPISAAILSGDAETGVTLMVMERGLDSGPLIAKGAIPIRPDATTESLTHELANVGAELVKEHLCAFAAGELTPIPQPASGVTLVRPLTKADGWIDWSESAEQIERQIRAMWPWPRAWTDLNGANVQIHAASVAEGASRADGRVGTIEVVDGKPVAVCGEGTLRLDRVQFPGKSAIDGWQAALHGQLSPGMTLNGSAPNLSPMIVPLSDGTSTSA